MRTKFLCISVLRVASGPRVKLVGCKSVLNPSEVFSTDRSKAVVPVLVLLFVVLWFILPGDLFCVALCYFVLVFFGPFSIAITSFGEERANLSAFRTFVQFVLVWFCLFPPWFFLLPFCHLSVACLLYGYGTPTTHLFQTSPSQQCMDV